MMRRWWKVVFIQDLVCILFVHVVVIFKPLTSYSLESLPDCEPEDQDLIDLLKKDLQGGTSEWGGTLQNFMAWMAAENNPREYSGSFLCHVEDSMLTSQ